MEKDRINIGSMVRDYREDIVEDDRKAWVHNQILTAINGAGENGVKAINMDCKSRRLSDLIEIVAVLEHIAGQFRDEIRDGQYNE